MIRVRTLILGGGMSGLSCAYHLRSDYRLLERSDEPGGLSRSIKHEGFVFDHTGHLLHLRHPYTLQLIPKLLQDNLVLNERRAWIYSNRAYTRYPFQANTYGLPARVIKECLNGLLKAQLDESAKCGMRNTEGGNFYKEKPSSALRAPCSALGDPESFRSWVLRTFGRGFAKHFFFPYNEKLWQASLDALTAEWVAPFVPRPSLTEIIAGAFTDQTKKFGYNATFFYPREGGIQALAFAFAKHLSQIQLRTEVAVIDLARKEVTTSRGDVFAYEHLVNTLPLVRFLAMARPLPAKIKKWAGALRWTSVYNLNIGVNRPDLTDKHWIYFPEKKYRFYRVGFPMNFAPAMTPPGCSSMYIEIACRPGHLPDDQDALRDCFRGLRSCGLLEKGDRIVTQRVLHIPIAYVLFDENRTPAVRTITSFLNSQDVHSIGRFGAWKYSYMEEAILEGKATAEELDG